ncbi:MAG: hypothetical protein GF368_01250 [Candidatus Aenigmarchaeota archaeon]|nr:hypothetical protein [Candidatus Aenigmarchaeota archaeon]
MKAQVSVEFLVYFGFLLLVSSLFLANHLSNSQKLSNLKMEVESQEIADKVSFEINSAVIAGNGYERNFYLEEKIGGFSNYTVEIGDYYVLIDWDGRSKISKASTKSINGTIEKGWNLIRNINGGIYVN